MKTVLLFLLLSLLATISYSQVSPDSTSRYSIKTKEYYLNKSQSQKKISHRWIVGSAVLFGAGVTAALGELIGRDKKDLKSALLLNGGLATFLISSAYSFSAKRNNKKAIAATVGQALYTQPFQSAFQTQSTPTVGLKILF